MDNDTNKSMILCSVSEVAKATDMKSVTVRKYSQMMEKYGYTIYKNELGHRGYLERDIIVMNRIKKASKNSGISLDDAVKVVEQMKRNDGHREHQTTLPEEEGVEPNVEHYYGGKQSQERHEEPD